MSALVSSFLRPQAAPLLSKIGRNLSIAPNSTLLCTTPVLNITAHGKGSTPEEVKRKAEIDMQDYWEKNIKLKRPWSPHLTIYSPPLCMRTSFLHRATGILMALSWMGAGAAGFLYTGHFDAMLDYVESLHLGPTILFGGKCLLAYPLVYHYSNGMRHLAWDYAIGFNMKTVNTTGTIVLICSILITIFLASIKT